MEIRLGENLRKLRKVKDITQEELAEAIGVSFQSVSKWERGDCFPDITLLPALANYFGVSTDELLGMDKIRDLDKKNKVFKIVHDYEVDGRYEDAIQLLRESIKVFPEYYSYHSELALALTQTSFMGDDKNELKLEAISLSEKVLANSTSEKVRSTTRANLVFLLHHAGEYQKAINLARTLPHIWECRELILPDLYEGKEKISAIVKAITLAFPLISQKIDDVADTEKCREKTAARFALGLSECLVDEVPSMADKILNFMK